MNKNTIIFGCTTYPPNPEERGGIDVTFQRHKEVDGLIALGAFEVFEDIPADCIRDMISALQAIAGANEGGRNLQVYTDLTV